MFGSRTAKGDLEHYLEHGPGLVERSMVEELGTAVPLAGSSVLDIGGGVGALLAELLQRGAASGEVIEIVAAYAPFAAQLSRQRGLEGRAAFRVHDLLAEPESVEGADVVVMNRVVCCSADGLRLAAAGAGLTRRALALSFPRSTRFTRLLAAAQRVAYRLLGRRYRTYAWPQEQLVAAAEGAGLRLLASGGGLWWRYVVMVRG